MAWLSEDMQRRTGLDAACLGDKRTQALSHDNLSHSVLGLMGVSTSVYQSALDIFDGCRQSIPAATVQQQSPPPVGQGPA
jgi:lipid A ethanolaminephosphotransferase